MCRKPISWLIKQAALLGWVWLITATPFALRAGSAPHGMVASAHPLATDAGLAVLRAGGNAIDAAVAVGLTLGVVEGDNSGIGGGCFLLIRRANGSVVALDGRETAPAKARRNLFVRDGKADTQLSQTGALASGVPGALAAYEFAAQHYGKKPFKELILPAAIIAETGFAVDARYAKRLEAVAQDMRQFEATRAVFFRANGKPLPAGDWLRQPDLAATYRHIAAEGSRWFYRGPFARALQTWMQQHGGILTARDLRDYRVQQRQPLRTRYRDWEIVGFPPPSSGGVHVAQMLNILEPFDLPSLDEPTRLHVIAEAMKLAFADRAYWLGDPGFVRVPRGLVDKEYGVALAAGINRQQATRVTSHGTPPAWQQDVFKKHTTHFSVADAEGNWVACTATLNTSFGSKVIIPGTGVMMNNEMDDFSTQPGVPNAFGLLGAEANAVAPGKRPLSSMSPTIVLKQGQPVLALGAAGGPKIISTVLVELVGLLDLRMSPAEAIALPRIHHQWFPDELMVEKSLPVELQNDLARRGHTLKELPSMAVSHIVARSPDGNGFVGAADPRANGKAAGW